MQRLSNKTIVAMLVTVVSVLLVVAFMTPTLLLAQKNNPTISSELKNFDAMVRQSRLNMPKFCGLVQQLMKMPSGDKEKQAAALKYIQTVKSRWEAVQQKFQNNLPVEYQQDKDFKNRLAEIHTGMENMEVRLQEGKYKESFQACAMTCGLFVNMHEENHLTYALDKLFHLRKMTKMIMKQDKDQQAAAVQQQIGKLLELRNQALLAPCPAPEDKARCNNYQESLKALSAQLDKLAIAANKNNVTAIPQNLEGLSQHIKKAYMTAL